ncbi:MAG: hypothetical protein BWZ08_01012 [candidate division BRC1 bacterium ADurb.BinA292]|nr:MAG: hypothetical protein BWZ08_01012 [candidate division BRC1 bacterium ADurb.BinA292]
MIFESVLEAEKTMVAMPARAIRTFVWDFADEGVHEVLGRLADSGVNGVHLALACHGGRYYCPHNPKRALVHAPDGALYFQPLLSCYDEIKPRVHPEFGSGAFVARLIESMREYDMIATAWVTLFNNQSLSLAFPECTMVNALGDRLEGTLCPAHPAVRGYAQALVEDLAHRVGVDMIELQDFAFPSHDQFIGARWVDVPVGQGLGYLLSLCFCEHCRRRAEELNLEVDDLAQRVERMLHRALAGDLSERRLNDEIADPYNSLARYAEARAGTITTLVDELNDATDGSHAGLQLVLAEEPDDAWRWGIALHTLRQRMLRATLQPGRGPAPRPTFVSRYAEVLQLGRDLAVDIPLGVPHTDDYSPAGAIQAALESGIDHFVFSHYGLVPLDMLDWIDALARR